MQKNVTITLREDDYRVVEALAAKAGISVYAWCKQTIVRRAERAQKALSVVEGQKREAKP